MGEDAVLEVLLHEVEDVVCVLDDAEEVVEGLGSRLLCGVSVKM